MAPHPFPWEAVSNHEMIWTMGDFTGWYQCSKCCWVLWCFVWQKEGILGSKKPFHIVINKFSYRNRAQQRETLKKKASQQCPFCQKSFWMNKGWAPESYSVFSSVPDRHCSLGKVHSTDIVVCEVATHAIWNHTVTCHPADVAFPPLMVLDLSTTGSADLAGWLHIEMIYSPKDLHPSQY